MASTCCRRMALPTSGVRVDTHESTQRRGELPVNGQILVSASYLHPHEPSLAHHDLGRISKTFGLDSNTCIPTEYFLSTYNNLGTLES